MMTTKAEIASARRAHFRAIFSVRKNLEAFSELARLLTKHRELTLEMAKREITDRFRGQVFGTFWAVLHPLILILVYIFLFVMVFKVRIGGTATMPLDYTTYILSGLIPWLMIQDAMAKSCTVIVGNANLVKQVVFPIEVLPIKTVIASLVSMGISLAFLLVYVLCTQRIFFWTYALLPVLIALLILGMAGIAFFLSAAGVYIRDMKDLVQVFNFVGFFLIPMFYLPEQVPRLLRPILYLNPFSYTIWCFQDALYFGRFAHWWAWIVYALLSLTFFYGGFRVFKKLRTMFGNAL
jgi:lipopolysaccharide transport system permease protein